MEYTKKQRREIYLDTADIILKRESFFICCALDTAAKIKTTASEQRLMFEEFFLFQPETTEGLGWWRIVDCESRINALLLCAEMCND
jgi:hypothetical protein